MDWLGGWLKSVIMVIMLATFVDLLLPSSTMQRYVKTVMSLFVLLTLLSPVMQLFKKDWNVDELIGSAEKKQNETTQLASNGKKNLMKSLDDITKEALKLKAQGQKQSQQIIQTELAQLLKDDIQKQTDFVVQDVKVLAQFDNNGEPSINLIKVTLDDIEAKKKLQPPVGQQSIAVMEPVQPIAPIRLEKEIKVQGSSQTKQVDASVAAQLTPRLEQERERLTKGITRDWQVKSAQVDIQFQQQNGRIAR
ncbi:stage III sporulation protein AF [Paenibacillus sp. SYP-B3998]|uniref:Stage III sporulation protein AF n=1 Tax=Paenibacillus sp. SYP-B3998 TaxID=2678564 RepID=A0A6G3ZXT0_9BACL|nr:stage III sporulation protein AF [Paenibacillus sp. SYP-B3998]NEW06217.1 stage III sporulation protein AF [Paenibacillus sp. SYP-B3998]